jgi:hypothetical protein
MAKPVSVEETGAPVGVFGGLAPPAQAAQTGHG